MSKIIKVHPENPHERAILQIVEVLENGGIIIFPSDTVYAIGCDTHNPKAMEKLARFKGVKPDKAHFSIICNNLSHLASFAKPIETSIFRILKAALPGSFTFILQASKEIPITYKGKKTIGIRVPNHKVPHLIVEKLGRPISSTSIHNTDENFDYIIDPELIAEKFSDKVDLIVDAGMGGNIASTIVDISEGEFKVLRQGKGNIEDFI